MDLSAPRVVLVCGDRHWQDPDPIERELRKLRPGVDVVVEGECPFGGADTIARDIAKSLGIEVRPYPADFEHLGPPAGPRRNREMLHKEHPHVVIAFHKNLRKSRGTLDMVLAANEAGVPVIVHAR